MFEVIYNLFFKTNWYLGFLDTGSGFGDALINLYNVVGCYLVFIFILVLYLFIVIIYEAWFKISIVSSFLDYFDVESDYSFINLKESWIYDSPTNKFYTFLTKNYEGDTVSSFLQIADIAEYYKLEQRWTLFPGLILIAIVIPSYSVEYWSDPKVNPFMVVKVTGNQWYWSYTCHVDSNTVSFYDKTGALYMESAIISEFIESTSPEDLWDRYKNGQFVDSMDYSFDMNISGNGPYSEEFPFSLLDVDNSLVLPVGVPVSLVITSSDVLHSWTVPSLGVKIDAVPGRLNTFMLYIDSPGMFFGQCSELCGPYHGFMPIVIEGVSMDNYIQYLAEMCQH